MSDRQQKRYANDWQDWHSYMAAKQQKLSDQFMTGYPSADIGTSMQGQMCLSCPPMNFKDPLSTLFNGVAIFVNGYTIPTAAELRQLMQFHGGTYNFYYDNRTTTHIIATNLANSKISSTPLQKVVRPEWITDSIRAGRLLPCEPYMPYSLQPPSQTLLNFRPVWNNAPPPPVSDTSRRIEGFYRPFAPIDTGDRNMGTVVAPNDYPTEVAPCDCCGPYNHPSESQRCGFDGLMIHSIPKVDVQSLPVMLDRDTNWGPSNGVFDPVIVHHDCQPQTHYLDETYDASGQLETHGVPTTMSNVRHSEMSMHTNQIPEHTSVALANIHNPNVPVTITQMPEQSSVILRNRSLAPERMVVALDVHCTGHGLDQMQISTEPVTPFGSHHPNEPLVSEESHSNVSVNVREGCDPRSDVSLDTREECEAHSDVSMDIRQDCDSDTNLAFQNRSSPEVVPGVSNSDSSFINQVSLDLVDLTEFHKNVKLDEDKSFHPGDPNFLSEFYSRSRLHYISTMRLEFQEYVADLQHNWNGTFSCHQHLRDLLVNSDPTASTTPLFTPVTNYSHMIPKIPLSFSNSNKVIMHIDMDCFFVSVGLRNYPQFKGKPVAVSHATCNGPNDDPDARQRAANSMSEIASCNYEARAFGVTNGMFLGEALRCCPDLITIPYDFDAYKEAAKKFYFTVATYTLDIEAVSCDELYVECANVLKSTGATPEQLAAAIRTDVEAVTECTCSVGIASNFLLARMATRRAKPNGVFRIPVQDEAAFMLQEEVRNLPGVGPALELRLWNMNIETCAELQKLSLQSLKSSFGPKMGQSLYNLCRGVDDRDIQRPRPRQSVSAGVNYGIRFSNHNEVVRYLVGVAKEVSARLKRMGSKGRVFTLKLMIRKPDAPTQPAKFLGHGACSNIARSVALNLSTDDATIIWRECGGLLKKIDPIPTDIRGIGIQVSKLSHSSATMNRYNLRGFLVSNDSPSSLRKENKDVALHPSSHTTTSLPSGSNDIEPYDEGAEDQHCLSKDLPLLEVKALIKDWIESHETPLQEDLDVVGNFLCNAVEDYNLEKVDLILKFLLKSISTRPSPGQWMRASRDIALKVQQRVKQWYGGQIKICFPPKFCQ